MPILDFEGKTFVAFLDISGFKVLMNEKRAWEALSRLYKYGYEVIKHNRQNNIKVEGFFLSDSGILFVRDCSEKKLCLKVLLKIIRELNRKMLDHDFMLTTSIAYGYFKYQKRIEFEGIEKNSIYGNAYVSAFLDNEKGKPKIQPGQCRIVREKLPQDLIQSIEHSNNDEILRMIRKRDNDNNHFYFYWMEKEPSKIKDFEKRYKDSYNLKYGGMLKALKG